ncbi:MAG TPA: transposase [Desulfomonilaceae bacterium]|nr:transposase [Desulfomonilaceae bacterium]
MESYRQKYHRRSIRLQGHDYSLNGAYFVTICAWNRECLFGEIATCEMRLNDLGLMVEKWWLKLSAKFTSVETDAYMVMPNHLHGIIMMVGADPRVCPDWGAHAGAPLPSVVQWFKTMTTNEYFRRAKECCQSKQGRKLWQRNYYEHIIRNERTLNAIRGYIEANPQRWANDPENPFGGA